MMEVSQHTASDHRSDRLEPAFIAHGIYLPEVTSFGDEGWEKALEVIATHTEWAVRKQVFHHLATRIELKQPLRNSLYDAEVRLDHLLEITDPSLPKRNFIEDELIWAIDDGDLATLTRFLEVGLPLHAQHMQLALERGRITVVRTLVTWGCPCSREVFHELDWKKQQELIRAGLQISDYVLAAPDRVYNDILREPDETYRELLYHISYGNLGALYTRLQSQWSNIPSGLACYTIQCGRRLANRFEKVEILNTLLECGLQPDLFSVEACCQVGSQNGEIVERLSDYLRFPPCLCALVINTWPTDDSFLSRILRASDLNPRVLEHAIRLCSEDVVRAMLDGEESEPGNRIEKVVPDRRCMMRAVIRGSVPLLKKVWQSWPADAAEQLALFRWAERWGYGDCPIFREKGFTLHPDSEKEV